MLSSFSPYPMLLHILHKINSYFYRHIFQYNPIAAIISESGRVSNYRCFQELEKLAGLNIYEVSSGKHRDQRRISKIGRSLLRHKLYFAALLQTHEGMPLYYFYRRLRVFLLKAPWFEEI